MAQSKYLAFDFGAESGRAIIGTVTNDRFTIEEIHRFPNKQCRIFGHLYWDVLYLFEELKKGLALAVQKGHADIASIGIDTWGVDFGFIGKDGALLGFPHTYHDSRTDGMMAKVFEKMPRTDIYAATGIQFMQFNSLYQLYSIALRQPRYFALCHTLLFMPDIFNYFLTGEKAAEYTIASTSQMLNAVKKEWDDDIFSRLGLPRGIMAPIVAPGTVIGTVAAEVMNEVGLKNKINVVAVGSHDTASAVVAVPARERHWAYLSSGTWSLLGIESQQPLINSATIDDFTNEGGVGGTIRFLRNVMGMWLVQETRKVWRKQGKEYSYEQLVALASAVKTNYSFIDPNDPLFFNSTNMLESIRHYCRETNQYIPQNDGEIMRCIFESLALKYKAVIEKINALRGESIRRLHIIGGGSQNSFLNQLTVRACGIPATVGPVEATAIGNIMVQAIASGAIRSVAAGRKMVADSFPALGIEP